MKKSLLVGAAVSALASIAHGQLLVGYQQPGNGYAIGEFTQSGTLVNAALVTSTQDASGMVVSGSNLFVETSTGIAEYTTQGVLVNTSLITGLSNLTGIAISGSDLFVVSHSGTVAEYTTSGQAVNTTLITGLSDPWGVVVSGSNLFITSSDADGFVGEYTTSGATVNASLIPLDRSFGISIYDSNLYILNYGNFNDSISGPSGNGEVSEYTEAGVPVAPSLIILPNPGSFSAENMVMSDSTLYVADFGNGSVEQYDVSGDTSGHALITGFNGGPYSIAVVPEPSLVIILSLLPCLGRRRRR